MANTISSAPTNKVSSKEVQLPAPQIFEFLKKQKINYRRWNEKPETAVVDLRLFGKELQTKLKNPRLSDTEKQPLKELLETLQIVILDVGENPEREKVRELQKQIEQEEKNDAIFAAQRDTLSKEVFTENVKSIYESAKKVFVKNKIAGFILGAAVLWYASKFFTKTKTGKFALYGLTMLAAYIGIAKVAEAHTNGENTFGLGKLSKAVGLDGKESSDYLDLYKNLGLKDEWEEETAALSNVPVKTLIKLYEEKCAAGSGKKEINLRDSRLSGYLPPKNRRKISGADLYELLDQLFGRDFQDTLDRMHPAGELIGKHRNSDQTLGNFLLSLSKIENPTFGEKFLDAITGLRSATSGLIAKAAVNVAIAGFEISRNIIYFPIETLGKTFQTSGRLAYDKTIGKWFFENDPQTFFATTEEVRKKILEIKKEATPVEIGTKVNESPLKMVEKETIDAREQLRMEANLEKYDEFAEVGKRKKMIADAFHEVAKFPKNYLKKYVEAADLVSVDDESCVVSREKMLGSYVRNPSLFSAEEKKSGANTDFFVKIEIAAISTAIPSVNKINELSLSASKVMVRFENDEQKSIFWELAQKDQFDFVAHVQLIGATDKIFVAIKNNNLYEVNADGDITATTFEKDLLNRKDREEIKKLGVALN